MERGGSIVAVRQNSADASERDASDAAAVEEFAVNDVAEAMFTVANGVVEGLMALIAVALDELEFAMFLRRASWS